MIIIINGPCGIGKTTVAWELYQKFDRSVMLDGDYIGAIHPFEIYDTARITYLYKTIQQLVRFHSTEGHYENFVINYVFETSESLSELKRMLIELNPTLYTIRLTCEAEELERRLYQRHTDTEELVWYLERCRELTGIQDAAAQKGDIGYPVDTTGLTVTEVAERIWAYTHEKVRIVPYDPDWPAQYEMERQRIVDALGDIIVEIHHIGSTSVPGLPAKPIIDITFAIRKLEDFIECIPPLRELGYTFVDYPENTERYFFRKGQPRTHHLHIVEVNSEELYRPLDFRDALRASPTLRERYAQLKYKLAREKQSNRNAYTKGKGALIEAGLREWRARKNVS